jgi:hypothetical protein
MRDAEARAVAAEEAGEEAVGAASQQGFAREGGSEGLLGGRCGSGA